MATLQGVRTAAGVLAWGLAALGGAPVAAQAEAGRQVPAHLVGVRVAPGVLRAEAVFQAPPDSELRTTAEANGGVALRLPGWAGVDFAAAVDSVAVLDASGRWLPGTRRPSGAWIVPNAFAGDQLAVRWQVRSDKAAFAGTGRTDFFLPTLLPDHVFVWGHAWVLRPDGVANLPVRVSVGAQGWDEPPRMLGAESGVVARFRALPRLLLVAGAWDTATVQAAGQSLRFFLRPGPRAFSHDELLAAVGALARAQAAAMGGPLPVAPTFVLEDGAPGNAGGTVEGPLVALYPDPTRPLEADGAASLRLVAHELFHFWNGTHARPDTTVGEGHYKWFQEGVTEYVARRTLLRLGLLDPAGFIGEVNTALTEYAASPVAATATAAVLAERYWEDEAHRTLPYVKGFLVGFLADLRIRHATGGQAGIDAWLRRALRPDLPRGPLYTDASLLRALEMVTGRDEGAWYRAHATGAGPLPVAEACAAHGLVCREEDVAVRAPDGTASTARVLRLVDAAPTRTVVDGLRR